MTHLINLTVRPVRVRDLPEIYEIEERSFKEPYPPSFISALAYRNPETFLVAERGGRVVGYIVATLERGRVGHIVSIAVTPEQRRRGIGSMLMLKTLEVLRRSGAKAIRLEVRRSNIAAQRFYEKFGLKRTSVIKNYYGDEDAYVFAVALSGFKA